VFAGRGEEVGDAGEGAADGAERKLEEDGSQRAAKDDQSGGGLQYLAKVSTFHQQPSNDADNCQENAADTRFIHGEGS
jgi:hypothetical protein